jgi:4'-phosphopantetheinyl transferase
LPLPNSSEDIQLIFTSLAASDDLLARFRGILSADELARASRFRFDKHRNAFLVARGLLRLILGRYTNTDSAAIQFTYGPQGKPEVVDAPHVRFNLSHSESIALYGIRRGGAIGVDVEYIRAMEDLEDIARHFFCAAECEDLLAVPQAGRQKAFFNCWTRKEAFIKAIGEGLSHPLDRFRVALRPDEAACLISVDGRPGAETDWSLHDIAAPEGYVAAVALAGRHGRFDIRRFESPRACAGFCDLKWQ